MDMENDILAQYGYGKAALKKLAPVSEGFRLYKAAWRGDEPNQVMELKGAVFRIAKSGPNKGRRTVMEAGTTRTVYVTRSEIEAASVQ